MSHVISHKKLVKSETTKLGNLIEFEIHNERALGIVLEHNEDKEPLVGLIISYLGLPHLTRIDANELCVSYENDWSIEPLKEQSMRPRRPEPNRRAGLLALSRHGWHINFATSNPDGLGRFNWNWYDLNTFEKINAEQYEVVLYDSWNLWSPATDRERIGAEPLIHYMAKSIASR